MTPDQALNKAKEYIWRQNPPATIDSEGLEIVHELMAQILYLTGKAQPETDEAPPDKSIKEQEEKPKVTHLIKGQARMEF